MSEVDDCTKRITEIFNQKWDIRDGEVVPDTVDVKLADGGVKLEGVVLYADLKSSSILSQISPATTVAKIVRAYLHIMSRMISIHDGDITSFDGDRVMAIFVRGPKNTNAATCALKMNYAVTKILAPMASSTFESISKAAFVVSHGVGIDRSDLLGVRAGQRGSNDLVWVGRAPNLAAKLSELREGDYRSFITGDVYDVMLDEAKFSNPDKRAMWEQGTFQFAGAQHIVYRSNWTWTP